jgi:tetratricopeptide (TPR) repeat protein
MRIDAIAVGPFELHACIGAGGMGQVWRGVHRARGVPIALKVIRTPGSRRFTLAFRNEVRQVAKLDHPHVVRVLDYGEVDELACDSSGGRLPEGAPYYAMEYASGGSLAEHLSTPIAWEDLREALLALLAGLGHAHARGVLHRDLSPRNVLFAGPADARPGLKLADFGLARGGLTPEGLADGGTPSYMPPEQFAGDTLKQGPWSDLYALGCVAWEMIAGSPPFLGRTNRDLHRQHTSAPPPPLVPRAPVPMGLEGWLLKLLQKDPRERFRFAADAAQALAQLGEPESVEVSTGGATEGELSGPVCWDDGPEPQLPAVQLSVPDTFRTAPDRRHPLEGVGLGLYELRTLPLIDRIEPANALWSALQEAWASRRPRLVVLSGETGHGKTHLARWIAWRAHELAGAELVTVEHSPQFDPTDGLRYALAQALGCVGASPAEMAAQLRWALQDRADPYDQALLARYLTSADLPPAEQDALVVRLLSLLSSDRPLVLRLEDVHYGPDSERLARALLHSTGPLPVLLVATLAPPVLAGMPEGQILEIGPLPVSDQLQLVSELLSLEPSLAERLVHRTAGSPLFAERMVGDWVRREVLLPTPGGFVLARGTADLLPDDLHQVWTSATERALGTLPAEARTALHVGGALGMEIDREDWTAANARLGILDPELVEELADALCTGRLAEPRDAAGWRLVHPLVWESLRRTAVDRGLWEQVNRACAEMLAARPQAPRLHERLGMHLLEAGQLQDCLEPLLIGARRCLDTGDLAAAQSLLDRRDEVLRALAPGGHDPRWAEGELARIRALVGRGNIAAAQAQATALAERCRKHGWRSALPEALRLLGLSQLKLGKLLEAEAMFALAQSTASLLSTREAQLTVARCAMYRGTILRIRGTLEESVFVLESSLEHFERLADTVGVADCLSELGHARLTLQNDLGQAQQTIERALSLYEGLGHQVGVATCVNTLGDIFRRRGDLQRAQEAYGRALTEFDRLGSDARLFPRLNLGVLLLGQGEVARADVYFAEAQELIERSGRAGLLATVRVCRLPAAAARADWEAWDTGVAAIDASPPHPDLDLAATLELASELAQRGGSPQRASDARARAAQMRLAVPTSSE